MRTVRDKLSLLVVVLGFVLFGGCYTQLALHDDESAGATEPQPAPIVVAPPAPEQPWIWLPSVTVAPSPAPEPQTRDIGNQRSAPARTEATGTGARSTGTTRGGR